MYKRLEKAWYAEFEKSILNGKHLSRHSSFNEDVWQAEIADPNPKSLASLGDKVASSLRVVFTAGHSGERCARRCAAR